MACALILQHLLSTLHTAATVSDSQQSLHIHSPTKTTVVVAVAAKVDEKVDAMVTEVAARLSADRDGRKHVTAKLARIRRDYCLRVLLRHGRRMMEVRHVHRQACDRRTPGESPILARCRMMPWRMGPIRARHRSVEDGRRRRMRRAVVHGRRRMMPTAAGHGRRM